MRMERIVAFTSTLLAVTPSYYRDKQKEKKRRSRNKKTRREGKKRGVWG